MSKKNGGTCAKTYGLIGKSLCGCAGGIVGFIMGGPFLALPGVLAGVFSGHILEKGITSTGH